MKRILVALLIVSLLAVASALPVFAADEVSSDATITEEEVKEEEVLQEEQNIEGFVVRKLPFGVAVLLEPDELIKRPWSKSFTFDIDHDWEDDASHATTGIWFGNGITSYWVAYSRDLHTEDPGRASFSFSYAF